MSRALENTLLEESEYFQDLLLSVDGELRALFPILDEELFFDFARNFRSWWIAFEAASNVWALLSQSLTPIKSRLVAIAETIKSASTLAASANVRVVICSDGHLQNGVARKHDGDDFNPVGTVLRVAPNAVFLGTAVTSQGREFILEKGGLLTRLTPEEMDIFITTWNRWIGVDDEMELAVNVWIERYGMWGAQNL